MTEAEHTRRRTRLIVDIEWRGHPDAEPGDEYYQDSELASVATRWITDAFYDRDDSPQVTVTAVDCTSADRGRDSGEALTSVRTVLSRAETALEELGPDGARIEWPPPDRRPEPGRLRRAQGGPVRGPRRAGDASGAAGRRGTAEPVAEDGPHHAVHLPVTVHHRRAPWISDPRGFVVPAPERSRVLRTLTSRRHRTMEGAAMLTTVGTEPVSLEDLQPFPGNARRGDVDLILDSLRANGQYKPLTVRRHGDTLTVLAGNHTYLALLRHEEDDRAGCADWELSNDRPCQVCVAVDRDDPTALAHIIECDDATARRINVVDNRAADVGDYDREALAVLLSAMDNDLAGTGFTESEAYRLVSTDLPDGFPAFDEAIAAHAPASPPPTGTTTAAQPANAETGAQAVPAVRTKCPNCGHEF